MLLDTQAMLWLRLGDRRLGTRARHLIDRAWQSGEVCVSANSIPILLLPLPEQRAIAAVLDSIDEALKKVDWKVEGVIVQHKVVINWTSNLDVQCEMRRDIKRELRPSGDYAEDPLEELADRIVELARRRL